MILKAREVEQGIVQESPSDFDLNELIRELERDMASAAASLEYERAALLRDQITELKSGSGVAKIEPKRTRLKYPTGRRARKRSSVDGGQGRRLPNLLPHRLRRGRGQKGRHGAGRKTRS